MPNGPMNPTAKTAVWSVPSSHYISGGKFISINIQICLNYSFALQANHCSNCLDRWLSRKKFQ